VDPRVDTSVAACLRGVQDGLVQPTSARRAPASLGAAVLGFTRPHTIVGTVVSVVVLFVMAVALPTPVQPGGWALLAALAAGLAVNVYIVGLNQLTDVDIDRINKAWLPLPAGELSVPTARRLVAVAGVLAVGVGAAGSRWLLAAILAAAALGTAYSLPPLRFKRHHVLAAACIVGARGLVVNLLVFAHYASAPGNRPHLPAAVLLLTVVVTVLGLVIAWFKDLPDLEGDRQHAVGTLPLALGSRRVVGLGVAALLAAYAGAAIVGLVGVEGLDPLAVAGGHGVLGAALLVATLRLEVDDQTSVVTFYRRIWLLFYAEYLVFAVAALAG
jgi:homogentisate phytyltransferase / homogentisate geranylgeranyltransferase